MSRRRRPNADPPPPAKAGDQVPLGVLVAFALVLAPVGVTLAAACASGAWADAIKSETQGVVVDVRVIRQERPPARSIGPWVKDWQVEFDTTDGPRREWFRGGRYRDRS